VSDVYQNTQDLVSDVETTVSRTPAMFTANTLTASITGPSVPTPTDAMLGLVYFFTPGANGNTFSGSIKLQASVDGTNFCDVSAVSVQAGSVNSNLLGNVSGTIVASPWPWQYARISLPWNAGSGCSFTGSLSVKG